MTLTKNKQVTAQEIEYMLSEGLTKAEVARRLDISMATVNALVSAKKRHKWTDEEIENIVAMLEHGNTVAELAKDLDISINTIYVQLRKHGYTAPHSCKRTKLEPKPETETKTEEVKEHIAPRDPCPFQSMGYLQILSQNCVEARGAATNYSIDIANGLVYLHGGINGMITKEQLFSMERELMDIYRLLERGCE